MTLDVAQLRSRVVAALRTVRDPELPIDIYELGLIYDLAVGTDGKVMIRMTLTTPNCPVADALPEEVRRTVGSVCGVTSVEVELTWEPAWTSARMSPDARLSLEMMGVQWSDPRAARSLGSTHLTIGRTTSSDRPPNPTSRDSA